MGHHDEDDNDLSPFGGGESNASIEIAPLGLRNKNARSAAASRRDKLEMLKKARRGERISADSLPKPIFDQVSEEDYQKYIKKKIIEDDFVVDDDGKGYADYGDDFDNENNNDDSNSDASEADEDVGGFGKRRKNNKKPKKVKPEARVSTFFSKQAAKHAASLDDSNTPRIVHRKKDHMPAPPIVNEADMLKDIFGEIDAEVSNSTVPPANLTTTAPLFSDYNASVVEPLFKYDGIVGDFRTTKAHDLFANSYDHLLAISETDENDKDDDASYHDRNDDFDNFDDAAVAFETQEATIEHLDLDTEMAENRQTVSGSVIPVSPQSQQQKPDLEKKQPTVSDNHSNTVKIRKLETSSNSVKAASLLANTAFVPKFQPILPVGTTAAAPTAPPIVEVAGCTSWMSVMDKLAVGDSAAAAANPIEANISGSSTNNGKDYFEEDGKRLYAFWFDAFEMAGVVYLFAKFCLFYLGSKNAKVSSPNFIGSHNLIVCTSEGNSDTDIDVTMQEVFTEFDKVRQKFGVKEFKAKPVTRKYAFEIPGIPVESEYLKVAYPYKFGQIPSDTSGVTFSHIFGTNASALENFLIKRKIMGPCWIEIQDAHVSAKNISWTKFEVTCPSPKKIKPLNDADIEAGPAILKTPPPFVAMSISLRTVMNHQSNSNEIVAVCAMVYNEVSIDGTSPPSAPLSFSAIRPLTGVPMPVGFKDLAATAKKTGRSIEVLPNEKGLLHFLMAIMHRTDPDIIVGHNFIGVDLDILLHRLRANKVDLWSKIGRLRRTKWPKLQTGAGGAGDSTFQERTVASGRILCDTFMNAKDYVTKAKSYTLTNLAMTQLKIARQDLDPDKIPKMFWDANQLMWLVKHCETDCVLSASLMMKLQVLPLTKQLTGLAGNLWSRTIMAGSRADRNEFLLLHEFHNRKYIVPDKTFRKSAFVDFQRDEDDDNIEAPKATTAKRKPAYAGGLVLEPKKGLYE
ncbi:DNA polymerase alpha catalytic subunit, partial [Physocladia obscura]